MCASRRRPTRHEATKSRKKHTSEHLANSVGVGVYAHTGRRPPTGSGGRNQSASVGVRSWPFCHWLNQIPTVFFNDSGRTTQRDATPKIAICRQLVLNCSELPTANYWQQLAPTAGAKVCTLVTRRNADDFQPEKVNTDCIYLLCFNYRFGVRRRPVGIRLCSHLMNWCTRWFAPVSAIYTLQDSSWSPHSPPDEVQLWNLSEGVE